MVYRLVVFSCIIIVKYTYDWCFWRTRVLSVLTFISIFMIFGLALKFPVILHPWSTADLLCVKDFRMAFINTIVKWVAMHGIIARNSAHNASLNEYLWIFRCPKYVQLYLQLCMHNYSLAVVLLLTWSSLNPSSLTLMILMSTITESCIYMLQGLLLSVQQYKCYTWLTRLMASLWWRVYVWIFIHV